MNVLYLDVFSGISGDMFLGAVLDLGLELPWLEQELRKLNVSGYHLHASRKSQSQIVGIKFDVHLEHGGHSHDHDHGHSHGHDDDYDHAHEHHSHAHGHHHAHEHEDEDHHGHEHHHEAEHSHEHSRDFTEIQQLIESSTLSDWVKARAIAVFRRVAIAEGKIHGQKPEAVHFHEVGAIDSIVDIVGACIALEWLGKPRVLSAAVVEGTGWVSCAHGRFPIPTTATLEILGARGVAVTQCEEPHELVTPTGAALLAEFAESFGPMHGLVASKIGYGLGTRTNKTRPNVLRAILGAAATAGVAQNPKQDWETDSVTVLETNIDDCTAEILGHFVEAALAAGALDVFHTPVLMKKNRPGVLLTLLCASEDAERFGEMLLRETSAFGVRRHTAERWKLRREWVTVSTPYGKVEVKLGKLNGKTVHASPEFESCKKVATTAKAPLQSVYQAAQDATRELRNQRGA